MAKTTKQGVIIRKISDTTAVVETFLMKTHPIYKKRYKVVKNYLSHDKKNEYKLGDVVLIRECRPISKKKCFEIIKKVGSENIIKDEIKGEEVLGAEEPEKKEDVQKDVEEKEKQETEKSD